MTALEDTKDKKKDEPSRQSDSPLPVVQPSAAAQPQAANTKMGSGLTSLLAVLWQDAKALVRPMALIWGCWLPAAFLVWFPGRHFPTRYMAFFNYQAESLVQGKTALNLPPNWGHDVIRLNGEAFLPLPPLPAFLLMPFVARFGRDFPETLFSLIVYFAVLVALYAFIEQFASHRNKWERAVLFVFSSLGTVAFTCALIGMTWFHAVLCSAFFLLLGTMAYAKARTAWQVAGALGIFAVAATGRFHLGLLLPFLAAWSWFKDFRWQWKKLPVLFLPTVALGLFVAWWNWARFGNPFFLKYDAHGYATFFQKDILAHGYRGLVYVLPHLYHGVLGLPRLTPDFPFFEYDERGNGVLAMSPLFLYAFAQARDSSLPWRMALSCLVLVAIPVFTHFSTGWLQFGYRYFLDFLPFALLLLINARGSLLKPVPLFCVAVSLWFHIMGTLKFIKFF